MFSGLERRGFPPAPGAGNDQEDPKDSDASSIPALKKRGQARASAAPETAQR